MAEARNRNRRVVSTGVGLVLLCAACASDLRAAAKTAASDVRVVVDARVELMSIIFRLAGNPEYSQGRVASYAKAVDAHFGSFRNHQVVKLARELRRTRGISYDACMGMAVHVKDAYALAEKLPFEPRPASLDGRWQPEEARAFLKAARLFVRESKFKDFFAKHQTLYDVAQKRMAALLKKEGYTDWFDGFFGERAGARYTVALGMLNGGQCYGAHCPEPNGVDNLYCVLGVWQTDSKGQPEFTPDMLKTVVHEFCHSYANPIIDRHAVKMQAAGEKIFSHVATQMKRQAYGNWRTMLYESLVRASTLRYVRHHEGEDAAAMETARDKARGFLWIDRLLKLLGEYEADRKRYPTMEAFAPRLVTFFDEVAAKMGDHVAKGPKIVSISPANGQTGVDPSLTTIKVVFDRPMQDRSWSLVGGGPNCPKLTGKMWYDAKRTTWTAEVKLKPEWTYRFMLNSDRFKNFRSADGVPLIPVNVTFTTGKAKK